MLELLVTASSAQGAGSARAAMRRRRCLLAAAPLLPLLPLLLELRPAAALAGGLMDSERHQLESSHGLWHRAQRDRITFETACYYSYEPELPLGCQYSRSTDKAWHSQLERSMQRSALAALYERTGGETWRSSDNWPEGDPCWDFWFGVTCDEHGNVMYLELSDNRLVGIVPATINDLVHLIKIDLSSTEEVYFGHPNPDINRLSGVFPSIRSLYRLSELEISGNLFIALPVDLNQNAPTLRVLSASRNLLSAFPPNMGNFEKLHTLELGRNRISGRIPYTLGSLGEARVIQLEYNKLQGIVPYEITNMGKVEIFDVSHNADLSGLIPESILVDWPGAEYISIYNTSIGGYISSLYWESDRCSSVFFSSRDESPVRH